MDPIPLKEVDQNENAKRMAKDTMVATEIHNILANNQYDSWICIYEPFTWQPTRG